MDLPHFHPRSLDAEQRALYEAVTGGRAGAVPELVDDEGRLAGPFNAMLGHPPIGAALRELGGTLRARTVLGMRLHELVVLRVSLALGNDFGTQVHRRLARHHGVSGEELAELEEGRIPDGLGASDRSVVELVDALLTATRDPSDEARRCAQLLGPAAVTETVTLVGYYQVMAGLAATWPTTDV